MKFLIVLCALVACSLGGRVKVGISTFQSSVKTSAALGRIVNGHPAQPNQIPHQCSILSPVGGGSFSVCGGSLISPDWVLTAAHCAIGLAQQNVRCGTLQLTTGGTIQNSFGTIVHPQYNPTTLNNDVAVIPLPTSLVTGPSMQPIRLPTAGQAGSSFLDARARVSGWGATTSGGGVSNTLNYVDKRVISNTECAAIFGTAVVVSHVVCGLGYDAPNQSHCGGDSGGPLTIEEGGIPTQIGVVSFGAAAGCDLGFPAGYMRTADFVSWVNQHTSIPIRP
jgi:secreted trypsin-like serine protease